MITTLIPSFILAASTPSTKELIALMFWVAILAIVVWAVIALIKWSEIPIPKPVWIILTAVIGILLIILIAKMFGFLVV